MWVCCGCLMIADWLVSHLQQLGAWNNDGISRAARLHHCGHCGAPVLRGLDGDRAAMVATCQPQDIDHFGEYLALKLGLCTYTVRTTHIGGKAAVVLDPRYHWDIDAGMREPVVPQHRCGLAIPPVKHSAFELPPNPLPQSIDPPF
jgi:hypothetical protein